MILFFYVFEGKGTNKSPNSKKNSIFAIKKDDQNATGLHHIIRKECHVRRWLSVDVF